MGKYKLILFDMDGTILDTLDDLANAMNHSLAACGFPKRTRDEVRRFVGGGYRKFVDRALPEGSTEADAERLMAVYAPYYAAHCAECTAPYPGVLTLLEKLRSAGIRIAVVSNKGDAAVNTLSEQYFPGLFDASVGEQPGIRRKPAPDTVDAVLKKLGIDRADAAYVGDSEVDIETAVNAGMDGIIVTWGFRDRAQLEEKGAQYLADTVEELEKLLM